MPDDDAALWPETDRTLDLLQPGRTCWRAETARRAAFLVDAAAYFTAAEAAMSKARHSILILGWDFDPRIRLVPGGDGVPPSPRLQQFLEDLIRRRPGLRVDALIWDMALPIAVQHPILPVKVGRWFNPERLRYVLDGRHPPGACHHQKVVVVDDSVAFCGGMDFAGDRWDTPAHLDGAPLRCDPDGRPVAPHHDVAVAVDGPAARALGDLVRQRWFDATGEWLDPPPGGADAWPDLLEPDLTEVPVGIARTVGGMPGQPERREVEALYLDAIRSARRTIYFENQYFTSTAVGQALAERLADPDGPEIVVVCPVRSPSYFDHALMDPIRDTLVQSLRAADRYGRFRIYVPRTERGTPIIVHSKVMVVDDRLVRVGSANLNNRSMGLDTECDLALQPDGGFGRRRIAEFRNRLVAEHLGVPAGTVAAELARTGSLIRTIEALRRRQGRSLHSLPKAAATLAQQAAARFHLGDPASSRSVYLAGRLAAAVALVAGFVAGGGMSALRMRRR